MSAYNVVNILLSTPIVPNTLSESHKVQSHPVQAGLPPDKTTEVGSKCEHE